MYCGGLLTQPHNVKYYAPTNIATELNLATLKFILFIFLKSILFIKWVVLSTYRPVLHADIPITHKEPIHAIVYNTSFKQMITCSDGSVSIITLK